jgi:hypothetical protein
MEEKYFEYPTDGEIYSTTLSKKGICMISGV